MKCDLHIHTRYSDGFHSVEYVIEKAASKNLKAIAIQITTLFLHCLMHEDLQKKNIELITGVEINCEGTEILGYFFDVTYEPLLKIMEENAKSIHDVTMQNSIGLRTTGMI